MSGRLREQEAVRLPALMSAGTNWDSSTIFAPSPLVQLQQTQARTNTPKHKQEESGDRRETAEASNCVFLLVLFFFYFSQQFQRHYYGSFFSSCCICKYEYRLNCFSSSQAPPPSFLSSANRTKISRQALRLEGRWSSNKAVQKGLKSHFKGHGTPVNHSASRYAQMKAKEGEKHNKNHLKQRQTSSGDTAEQNFFESALMTHPRGRGTSQASDWKKCRPRVPRLRSTFSIALR